MFCICSQQFCFSLPFPLFLGYCRYITALTYTVHTHSTCMQTSTLSCLFSKAAIYLTRRSSMPPIPESKTSLKHCSRLIWFEMRTLLMINSLFALVVIIVSAFCLSSPDDLLVFFATSAVYKAFSYFEIVMNCLYSVCLFALGRRLLGRIRVRIHLLYFYSPQPLSPLHYMDT